MKSGDIFFYAVMAAGIASFLAGRFLSKKYAAAEKPSFSPPLFIGLAGVMSYLGTILSWVLAPVLILTALAVKAG